ncbi:MAG: hypothetical protein Q9220_000510 [cf. Caloplaca sp. 1 TL-2023]
MSSDYKLPRDDAEHARLLAQHNAIVALHHGTISFTPLSSPSKILDIGAGTGVLSLHFASTYPSALIYGVDPTPPPPEYINPKPTNLTFIQGGMPSIAISNESGVFGRGTFDLCFSRLVLQGIRDWPAHLATVAGLVKTEGYVEVQETSWEFFMEEGKGLDGNPRIDAGWRWLDVVYRETEKLGLDFRCGRKMAGWMRDAGLEVVEVKRVVWPFGTWLAEKGEEQARKWGELSTSRVIVEVLRRVLETADEVGEEEKRALVEECRRCMAVEEGKYQVFYITIGRKPV